MKKLLAYLFVGLSVSGCTTSAPPAAPDLHEKKVVETVSRRPHSIPYSAHSKSEDTGFILSPYAPEKGLIDVRGMKVGAEVCDPYTGKIFALERDYSGIKGPVMALKPKFLSPIEGHPGFYRTTTWMGYIDARQIQAGMELRDPYTGEIYIIPPYHVQQKQSEE